MTVVDPMFGEQPSGGVPFYTEKGNAQPRAVKGGFRTMKWWAMAVLLAWWHLSPFLRWDRGPGAPDQAILVDMAGRRAYFFFIEIWPQEVYYLTGLLLMAAISLFLMSALAGRVWCGFGCWQTVYTDLFVLIERLVLGDRNKRIAFQRQPWSAGKVAKLAVVNAAWLAIGAATGISFTLYFGNAPDQLRAIFTGQAGTSYVFIGLVGGLCFLLAGYARERVCVYMCPYSRFQAVMFDEHSLVVSYEAWRGEPRGHRRPGESSEDKGDCVDCSLCVAVCPTGTDIRRGVQLSCIGCGLCIDACNSVMDRLGRPRGLISYDSESNLVARSKGLPPRYKLIRPRTLLYGGIVALVGSVVLGSLAMRSDVRVDVLHERTPLAVHLSGDRTRNGYDYKILNMAQKNRTFTLSVADLEGATIDVLGGPSGVKEAELTVGPDSVRSYRIFITAHLEDEHEGNRPLTMVLTERPEGRTVTSRTFFAVLKD